jgi:predicted DNA-binding transcriptional regulator YafY
MSIRGKIKRLGLLIEHIQHTHYPSKQKLLAFLTDEGFETSPRTIDRDIEAIRDEFWLEIAYDRSRNGYYIKDTELINSPDKSYTSTLLKIFNLINTTDILIDSFKYGRKVIESVQFDGSDELKGINLLPQLLKAIKNCKETSFSYQNFYSEESRQIILKPLLLKEYSKRWYVVGYNDYVKNYRTYGVDRIENLKLLDTTFQSSLYQQPKDFFIHTVGLTNSLEDPQFIKIRFTKEQANYIKALPLHDSQEVESETSDGVTMTYYVRPNFEFKQKILMQMDHATVLEPKSLAEDIKNISAAILENYLNS